MPKRTGKIEAPKMPGAFLSDGSFSERAEFRHRGHIDRMVRRMVMGRREGSLPVHLAVNMIRAAGAEDAFPCVSQWELCDQWALVQTTSTAEETVKREGRSTGGVDNRGTHWCGQRWVEGP